jgi:2-iminobutanoate/2-iminopropanoate deaminase
MNNFIKEKRSWQMNIKIINTQKGPSAIGPYSQAKKINNLLFLSGQISIDPENNKFIDGNIEEQTDQVLKNIQAILEAGGSSLKDVIKVYVYLKNMKDFNIVNKVYSRYLNNSLPARVCVEVSNLPMDAKIEISVIAGCEK